MLSAARRGGWGFGTCVDRCMINHNIYDCDVFRSFFHLYNPYEPSESEKKLIVTDTLNQGQVIVASDVRGEYTQSAPLFVRFHSHRGDRGATHALIGCAQPLLWTTLG